MIRAIIFNDRNKVLIRYTKEEEREMIKARLEKIGKILERET